VLYYLEFHNRNKASAKKMSLGCEQSTPYFLHYRLKARIFNDAWKTTYHR